MPQRGLELRTNLAEPIEDRQAWENLAGPGIDQDIGIFVNNLKNTSELTWDPNGLDAGIIESSTGLANSRFLFDRRVPFTYTTGDEVTLQVRSTEEGEIESTDISGGDTNQTYYVVDFEFGLGNLRNQRAFGISIEKDALPEDISNLSGKYVTFVRRDAVSQRNLLRISTPDILNSPENTGEIGGDNFFSYNIGDDFNAAFDSIENNVNSSNFKRREKYTETSSVTSERGIEIQGTIQITDPADELANSSDLEENTAPGIFITDPFSNLNSIERTRAFSTSTNPWSVSGTELQTDSSQINIGDLRFEDDLDLSGVTVTSVSSTSVLSDFSHKLPIVVDGVEYSLLLKS
jgi:hypothetical protein